MKTPRVASLVGSFSITLSILLIGILLIGPVACLPIRHVNYDLASKDPTAVESLYQQLTEWINTSLAYCSEEQFSNASEELDSYSKFVLEVSLFREDIASRGIDAVILQPEYSTEALSRLGQATRSTIDDVEGANQSLSLARLARERGHLADLWVETLRARSYLRGLQGDLDRLESSIRGLPDFIDRADLTLRVLGLRGVLDRYNAMLAELQQGLSGPIEISFELDRTEAVLGEDLAASGTLTVAGKPFPGVDILIQTNGTTLAHNITSADGRYAARVHISLFTPPGVLELRALAVLESANISSRPIRVAVSKIPTYITFVPYSSRVAPGDAFSVGGLLLDYRGRGLAGRSVILQTGTGQRFSTTTAEHGEYSFSITAPPMEGSLSLRASFLGSDVYRGCKSPWINVLVTSQPGPYPVSTNLSTVVNATQATSGQVIGFEGRLVGEKVGPLTNQTVEFHFIGQTVNVSTGNAGAFNVSFRIPEFLPPGQYPAQAVFRSPTPSSLSSSASNITTITVLGPQGRNGTATTIELSARPTVVRAGEKVRFDGLLRGQDGQGIPGQEVEILFLSEMRRTTTDRDGSFTVGWTIPYAVDPGTHSARAIFNPPNASDLLPSSSNKVYVTILGRERSPTSIDIYLSPNPLALGQTLRVWGRLVDLWGGGLANKTIRIVSPNLTTVTGVKTRDDGSYSANITVSLVGRLVLQSRFEGDSLYKPSTSQQAWIDVVAERTEPLATKLTLKGPAKASVLQPIHLSGRLTDSVGRGIAGKNVTIVWDAVPLLVVVTEQDGGFSASTKAPLASPGIHRVFAIFSSGDGKYLSSQSDELVIRLYASIGPWREIGIGTAAIVAMLGGIAVARGRTPSFSRERVPQKKAIRTVERPRIQEAVPTAAVEPHPETATRRSILDNLPPELKGRELILRLYRWMLDFLARTYSFDPTSMTHTEILASLLSRGLTPQGATAARSLTRIYEKAAYSGEESTGADEEQFVHAVELLHSIIMERER